MMREGWKIGWIVASFQEFSLPAAHDLRAQVIRVNYLITENTLLVKINYLTEPQEWHNGVYDDPISALEVLLKIAEERVDKIRGRISRAQAGDPNAP